MTSSEDRYAPLRLDSQLCFPLYALSRIVTSQYQPLLAAHGLTYPQYLVLMVLWEEGSASVGRISDRLLLGTNTLTPLLKRMEQDGWLRRERSRNDERVVKIGLTKKAADFQETALSIPCALSERVLSGPLSQQQLFELKTNLEKLIDFLK